MTEVPPGEGLGRLVPRDVAKRTAEEYRTETPVIAVIIAETMARTKRFAFSKAEAAEALGVSVEFFDEHIDSEMRSVRRGRRRLYPVGEVIHWLWRNAEGYDPTLDATDRPPAD